MILVCVSLEDVQNIHNNQFLRLLGIHRIQLLPQIAVIIIP